MIIAGRINVAADATPAPTPYMRSAAAEGTLGLRIEAADLEQTTPQAIADLEPAKSSAPKAGADSPMLLELLS